MVAARGTGSGTAPEVVDAVVVGAGLSGLSAARALVAGGASAVVLEASDRVGGRVRSAQVAGAHVDLGGTFVGPGQDRVVALADAVGVQRYPTHDEGEHAIRWRGRTRRYHGTVPRIEPGALLDVGRLQVQFGRLVAQVPPDRPWEARRAAWMDTHSLGSWLRSVGATAAGHDLFAIVAKTTWGCEPGEVSLLHAVAYVARCGGLDAMLDTSGGAQEEHFVLGSAAVAERVADALADAGCPVRLGEPALAVEQAAGDGDDGVAVTTPEGSYRARRVVVAVPPQLRARIRVSPALPAVHQGLSARWPAGVLSKVYAVYERPFWREAGLSGQGLSDTGPVFATFDTSPPSSTATSGPGVLLGFVGGDYARAWDVLDDAERRARALSVLADLYGPAALDPVGYTDQRWAAQEWLGGGPCAVPGPGGVLSYAPHLAEPVGRVHWAGTETATRWAGFMDGAVSAGERAAAEVLALL